MNTTTIHIKTDIKTRDEAQKIAGKFGLNLTSLVNVLLKQTIRTKRIMLELKEEPTQYMLDSLKQSEEEVKAGRTISFTSPNAALDYLAREIEDEKQSAH